MLPCRYPQHTLTCNKRWLHPLAGVCMCVCVCVCVCVHVCMCVCGVVCVGCVVGRGASFVDIYWPRDRCTLLFHGVEIIDSPGLDLSDDHDGWIDQHCTDADVFVLVANSEVLACCSKSGARGLAMPWPNARLCTCVPGWCAFGQAPPPPDSCCWVLCAAASRP